jgi:hypothetical protein
VLGLGVALRFLIESLLANGTTEVVRLAFVFALAGCLLGLDVHPAHGILGHGGFSLQFARQDRNPRPSVARMLEFAWLREGRTLFQSQLLCRLSRRVYRGRGQTSAWKKASTGLLELPL